MSKLFNMNKLKISYRCLPNLKSRISSHNKAILSSVSEVSQGGCNCRRPQECPMDGECCVSDLVYGAEVVKAGEVRGSGHFYVGMVSGAFKARFANHTKSFTNERYEMETELSKFVWKLKRKRVHFRVHFKVLAFERPYIPEIGRCGMCLKEKIEIAKNVKENGARSLNRRGEVFRRCLHKGKYLLGNIDSNGARGRELEEGRGEERVGEAEKGGGVPLEAGGEKVWGSTRSGRNWREND